LAAKADTKYRDPYCVSLLKPLQLWYQPLANGGIVPRTPWRAHRDDDIEGGWIRELVADLTGSVILFRADYQLLDHLESVVGEPLGYQGRWAEGIVLHEKHPHAVNPLRILP
jgi:hypothetical protein